MAIRYSQNPNIEQIQHQWIALESISKNLSKAVVSAEDQQFYHHYGFDFAGIKLALQQKAAGKKLRGASTISQQTAKNVFLWPQRSWLRKGLEVWFTLLIEFIWTKERILEVYLNSIEMGEGVFGAQAAAAHWFKKSANKLTANEAALIAAILPNPNVYKAKPYSAYINKRRIWIRKQMRSFPFN
jgi:monofunctional biosynthetic peptidoglycan transglycosylase